MVGLQLSSPRTQLLHVMSSAQTMGARGYDMLSALEHSTMEYDPSLSL